MICYIAKKEKHKQILKNILGALEREKRQLFNNGSYNLSNIVVRTRLLLVSTRPMSKYSQIKTRKYPGDIPQDQNCCSKKKKDNKHNSHHLAWKCARIFFLWHHLFLKAHSFPRATVSENCALLGTYNIPAYFRAKRRLLFVYAMMKTIEFRHPVIQF